MVCTEQNTYFSSLLSQANSWEIDGIIDIVALLLKPFENLTSLESCDDISMLQHIKKDLPYKIDCYQLIINRLNEGQGMECDEVSINSFNDYCGLDTISFIHGLISTGYRINRVKAIRLFHNDNKSLQRALLLCKSLFPSLKVEAYNLRIEDILNETRCDALLTINLFPHTLRITKNIHEIIAKLIIKSRLIYSHSIFFENINYIDGVTLSDCEYYWEDLNACRFIKSDSRNFTRYQSRLLHKNYRDASFSIFSNVSINTIALKHQNTIVLPNLCPGVSHKRLFNENQVYLFFDKPFEHQRDTLDYYDDSELICSDSLGGQILGCYTLRDIIIEFPQYLICEGLDKNKEWAQIVYEHYYKEAIRGNIACYNWLAVIEMLKESCSKDYQDPNSPSNKKFVELLEMAIKGNDTNAMINLACFYISKGMHTKGIEYYELAYKNKSDVAAYSMGVVYEHGLYDYANDASKAIVFYKDALAFHLEGNNTDTYNHFPENICCLNLILLMYRENYPLCDINREYAKIKNPSQDLIYAFTVILNNRSNKAKSLFEILKLKEKLDEGSSYVRYNRLIALYKGVSYGRDYLISDKKTALKLLEELADSKCPDWPDWEKYVWRTLARWFYFEKIYTKAFACWVKAGIAVPEDNCAFQTNMAITKQLSLDKSKDIWNQFAFGNGCKSCHECSNYNTTERCCPKAQLIWAKNYETDKLVSQFLIEAAANQEYLDAVEHLLTTQILKEFAPNNTTTSNDEDSLRSGVVLSKLKDFVHLHENHRIYKLLNQAVDLGSEKAASILLELIEIDRNPYELYFLKGVHSNIVEKYEILKRISRKSIEDDYFQPATIIECDLLHIANLIAEQYIGGDSAFNHLKSLAEFYVKGENYSKALALYKIAEEEGNDVIERILFLENILNKQSRIFNHNYEDDFDYKRETWDAMTDGMYGDMPDDFDGDYDFLGR